MANATFKNAVTFQVGSVAPAAITGTAAVLTGGNGFSGVNIFGGSLGTADFNCDLFRYNTSPTLGYVLTCTDGTTGAGAWQAPAVTLAGTQTFSGANTFSGNAVFSSGFQISTSPTSGYILTSDASGNGTWQASAAGVTLAGTNAWTGTNSYNTNLPTSTLTPSSGTQLITKTYADATYATTAGTVTLAGTNAFTGTNTFNTNLPTSTVTPSSGAQLITKTYADTTYGALGGTQTFSGVNTFSGNAVFSSGFKLSTGATNTYVLTSDASGNGTWQAASGGGSVTLGGTNAWTGTNTYNTNLPTSTLTPSSGTQLITKTYADATYATTAGTVTLAGTQTFTGVNTFTKQPIMNFGTTSSAQSTFYGYLAGNAITSATKNTSFGYNSGSVQTSGSSNTLMGTNAGASLTTGGSMVVIGADAAPLLTTATNAVFIGNGAGQSMFAASSGGDKCVVIGSGAASTGAGPNGPQQVTAIGFEALKTCAGGNNVGLGYHAGVNMLYGNNNVCIGDNSGAGSTTCIGATSLGSNANGGNYNSSTAVGYSSACNANNQVMLGTSTEYVHFPGSTSAGSALFAGSLFMNMAQTSNGGSTSGNITWSQIERGTAFKKVVIYCNALLGTVTITFNVAFTQTPQIMTTNGPSSSVVTALSTTAVTITGATTNGFIFLEGF